MLAVSAGCRARSDSANSREERRSERELFFSRIAREKGLSKDVAAALERVPRHRYVPEVSRGEAYSDRPLPIGYGQTISQPSLVAVMTNAVSPGRNDRCLEIGTGSGYQTAVLAELCRQVFSIEILDVLAEQAKVTLREEGYGPDRVALRTGDGFRGWPEAAPFDAIVVTAAPRELPAPLAEQLAVDGRLVIPLGKEGEPQRVTLFRRVRPGSPATDGVFEESEVTGARFVPLVGEARER